MRVWLEFVLVSCRDFNITRAVQVNTLVVVRDAAETLPEFVHQLQASAKHKVSWNCKTSHAVNDRDS